MRSAVLYSENYLRCGIHGMIHFFLNCEMLVAGSTYRNMAYSQIPRDMAQGEECMGNMSNLGQNMAFLLKMVHTEEIRTIAITYLDIALHSTSATARVPFLFM